MATSSRAFLFRKGFSRHSRPACGGILALAVYAATSVAFAQEELAPTPAEPEPTSFSLSVGVGAAKMDEDYFARVRPNFTAKLPDFRLVRDAPRLGGEVSGPLWVVLDAPFNFRMVDRGEDDPVFRRADWDEVSEYLSILRRFEFGTPNSPVFWRFGAQANATLAHGTLLSEQMNTADIDHRRFGGSLGVHAIRGGIEFYFDDLFKPFSIGGRVYVRPWGASVENPVLSGLALGFSAVVDPSAPIELATGGIPPTVPSLDGSRYIEAERETTFALVGFDAEVPFARFGDTRWTAYTDLNLNPGAGLGWHVGTNIGWKPSDALVFEFDAEYQLLHDQYIARYFSWTYQATRFRLQEPSLDLVNDQTGSGAYFQAAIHHRDAGSIEVGTNLDFRSDAQADTFSVRLSSPADRAFRLGAVYALVRTDNFARINAWKDAWLEFEASYLVVPWMSATASIGRRYRAEDGEEYRPVDDFYLGVRFHKRWNKTEE